MVYPSAIGSVTHRRPPGFPRSYKGVFSNFSRSATLQHAPDLRRLLGGAYDGCHLAEERSACVAFLGCERRAPSKNCGARSDEALRAAICIQGSSMFRASSRSCAARDAGVLTLPRTVCGGFENANPVSTTRRTSALPSGWHGELVCTNCAPVGAAIAIRVLQQDGAPDLAFHIQRVGW